MLKILQWNINGYINNYAELQILIKNYFPKIMSPRNILTLLP